MISARGLRLILAAIAFLGWIGWLAFLAITTTRPIVLSRPQFMFSQMDIIADIQAKGDRPDPHVNISEVVWVRGDTEKPPSQKIEITNLDHITQEDGWNGPGTYIIPLVTEGSTYRVAAIPASPGYGGGKPRIYRLTPAARTQLLEIRGSN